MGWSVRQGVKAGVLHQSYGTTRWLRTICRTLARGDRKILGSDTDLPCAGCVLAAVDVITKSTIRTWSKFTVL